MEPMLHQAYQFILEILPVANIQMDLEKIVVRVKVKRKDKQVKRELPLAFTVLSLALYPVCVLRCINNTLFHLFVKFLY
jgi:hypothetical protein